MGLPAVEVAVGEVVTRQNPKDNHSRVDIEPGRCHTRAHVPSVNPLMLELLCDVVGTTKSGLDRAFPAAQDYCERLLCGQ